MRKILGIFIFMCLNVLSILSQPVIEDVSNTEIFCNKPQALIEKQFIEAGFVDMIDVRLMMCRNLSNGEKINALRFEYQTTNQVISQTKLAIVDEDEIEPLLNAVKTIIQNLESKRDNYTELTFRSRSGFVAGAYFSSDSKKWITYLQMNRSDVKSTVQVSKEEFAAFLDLLVKIRDHFSTK